MSLPSAVSCLSDSPVHERICRTCVLDGYPPRALTVRLPWACFHRPQGEGNPMGGIGMSARAFHRRSRERGERGGHRGDRRERQTSQLYQTRMKHPAHPARRTTGALLALVLAAAALVNLAGPAQADTGSDPGQSGSPVTALPSDASAADIAVAQAEASGQPVVIDTLFTSYAETTANPDGN